MNIFWLALCFIASAAAHCDQHVVKMPLEAAQILYTVRCIRDPSEEWRQRAPLNKSGTHGYRPTHVKHPLVVWAAKSRKAYKMVCEYGAALCSEYTRRYEKVHACQEHITWLRRHRPHNFPRRRMGRIPLCTNRGGRAKTLEEAVEASREFYTESKSSFARYAHSEKPQWLEPKVE